MTQCPDYAEYSKHFHDPGSGGALNLPFQRPMEACRRFTSSVIESVIDTVTAKIADLDLARLFTNAYPNTLDTTIAQVACLNTTRASCTPLSFVITGDINAMWLRDSANQLLPYLDYVKQDLSLKRLFLGAIYLQAQFINLDPYANAFSEPRSLAVGSMGKRAVHLKPGVFEYKWEVDSLASFLGLSYQYWHATGDDTFVNSTSWMTAVESVIKVIHQEQEPTFDSVTGTPLPTYYTFSQTTDRPTETQFLNGRGNPTRRTGLIKSLFRPSDDATIFPFFIPGNAMMSVELAHLAEVLEKSRYGNKILANEASRLSTEIRNAIYKYGVVRHPDVGECFAYEVDGYGSSLIMDDANVPSLLSLSWLGFVNETDPIYQNTRRLVLSNANPYYFSGPRGAGIGGPHVGLSHAWPMSQIVRILTSTNDTEIIEALKIILHSTDDTGLIHESFNVFDDDNPYTRSWFGWANGLFGQAILKIYNERPHILSTHFT
ncbi:DUF1237 domain-containing protein [Radiomyces spectabilis]|uniref:DUF1237 domain-containing protein n=1 Tax=Radiomyces spectabilis TaxID=64574 RepID=UPI00221F0F97|nr:DUF1237 domain-containing protein [Radiomyces spectabilis]KAI8376448.1 DUF1237 domain-containing protein [Radiomyces spectabilis]